MDKKDIINLLEKEKWYPAIKVTDLEWETSKLLNKILDNVIRKIKKT